MGQIFFFFLTNSKTKINQLKMKRKALNAQQIILGN